MIAEKKVSVHPITGLSSGGKNAETPVEEEKKPPKLSPKPKKKPKTVEVAEIARKEMDLEVEVELEAELSEEEVELSEEEAEPPVKVDEVEGVEKVGEKVSTSLNTAGSSPTEDLGSSKVVLPPKVNKSEAASTVSMEEGEGADTNNKATDNGRAKDEEADDAVLLTAGEIEGLRKNLKDRVKSKKRLGLAFKRLDIDSSGGLSKLEFQRLIMISAGKKNNRFLDKKGQEQIWEAAWIGRSHKPGQELPHDLIEEWIFLDSGAPQKIDD